MVPRERVSLAPASGTPTATLSEDEASTASRLAFTGRAALDVDVDGVEALRLRVSPDDDAAASALRRVRISVHEDATKLGGWTWSPRRGTLHAGSFRRVAFRPGEHSREVISTEFRTGEATRLRVLFEAREPDDTVTLRVEVAVLR